MIFPIIKFLGEEYLLITNDGNESGAITKREAFENGDISYAHLCNDGIVRRLGLEIGDRRQIEFIGECEPQVADDAPSRSAINFARAAADRLEGGR